MINQWAQWTFFFLTPFSVQKRAVRLGAVTPLAWLRAAGLGQPVQPNRGHRPRAGQHLLRAATGGASSRTQPQWRAGPRSASPTSVAAIRCGRRVAPQGQRGARSTRRRMSSRHSPLQRPPSSVARTSKRCAPRWSSSRYARCFRWRAAVMATASLSAARGMGAPPRVRAETRVASQHSASPSGAAP